MKNYNNIKASLSRRATEEFKAVAGVVLCKTCGAAYHKKSWRHGIEKFNKAETESISSGKKDVPVKFALCPACQMIKNRQYEGRITIKNLPQDSEQSLKELVGGFGKRAYEQDPMHRLIEMKKDGSNWVITTTENEMANKMAHKIKTSFSHVKSRTHFAGDPSDVAEITIEFS
ncbi:MAG: hypothetical protein Q7S83_02700 [bacterium]|nr:hypothetical protein [bacterium]